MPHYMTWCLLHQVYCISVWCTVYVLRYSYPGLVSWPMQIVWAEKLGIKEKSKVVCDVPFYKNNMQIYGTFPVLLLSLFPLFWLTKKTTLPLKLLLDNYILFYAYILTLRILLFHIYNAILYFIWYFSFKLKDSLDIVNIVKYYFFRVPVISRNCYNIVFRVVEMGVALWFPCVLWNCIRYDYFHSLKTNLLTVDMGLNLNIF